jgi:hypothetical protein
MLKRFVKLTFEPESSSQFLAVFDTVKNNIRQFPGLEYMELLQDTATPGVFFTLSVWQSDQDLENYRKSDLFRTTWSEIKPLFAQPAEAWSLKATDTP